MVLIVAECIVNARYADDEIVFNYVLIVAECIVNNQKVFLKGWLNRGFNSSRVYCKFNRSS